MDRYIDMHCHILPEVDDGAQSMEETRRMLGMAYREGVRYIIATPHHHPGRGRAEPEELRRQLRKVREEAAKISDRLKVFLGTEIYFGQDVPDKLKENKVLTINRTRYVLVEFSPSDSFEYIHRGIQLIQMKGYIVILAHVERYDCLREEFENVEYLDEMGVLIQVNTGSITGRGGRKLRKFVKELLERELVFCVGTDAHDSGKRAPHMKKAAEYVKKKYGEDYARRIFFSNAAEMLREKKRNESRESNEP